MYSLKYSLLENVVIFWYILSKHVTSRDHYHIFHLNLFPVIPMTCVTNKCYNCAISISVQSLQGVLATCHLVTPTYRNGTSDNQRET